MNAVKRFSMALSVITAGLLLLFGVAGALMLVNDWLARSVGLPEYWGTVFYFFEVAVAISAWYAVSGERKYL